MPLRLLLLSHSSPAHGAGGEPGEQNVGARACVCFLGGCRPLLPASICSSTAPFAEPVHPPATEPGLPDDARARSHSTRQKNRNPHSSGGRRASHESPGSCGACSWDRCEDTAAPKRPEPAVSVPASPVLGPPQCCRGGNRNARKTAPRSSPSTASVLQTERLQPTVRASVCPPPHRLQCGWLASSV